VFVTWRCNTNSKRPSSRRIVALPSAPTKEPEAKQEPFGGRPAHWIDTNWNDLLASKRVSVDFLPLMSRVTWQRWWLRVVPSPVLAVPLIADLLRAGQEGFCCPKMSLL